MRMRSWGGVLVWATMVCAPGLGSGQESSVPTGEDGRPSAASSRERLTIEFLEFLGEWETADGNWLGPIELESIALPPPEPVGEGGS